MKYLSDDIILTVNNLPTTSTDMSATYNLKLDGTSVFVGSLYKLANQTSLAFNTTQVLQSLKYENDVLSLPLQSLNQPIPTGLVSTVQAEITLNSSTYLTNSEDVYFAYPYPRYTTALRQYKPLPPGYQYVKLANMQQGVNASDRQVVLLPHIPYTNNPDFGFGAVYQQFNYTNPTIRFTGSLVGSFPLNCSSNTNVFFKDCQSLFQAATPLRNGEDMINDVPLFETGTVQTGTGFWQDATTAELDNSAQGDIYFEVRTSFNTFIQRSANYKNMQDGEVEVVFKMKGSDLFNSVRFGNNTDSVSITLNPNESAEYVRDTTGDRLMVLSCTLKKAENTFVICDIKILAETVAASKGKEFAAGLNLGLAPLAEVDIECMSDFYLEWVDRYGSFQCQGFDGKAVYSEDISASDILSYNGDKRLSRASVQGKIQINTGYIEKDSAVPVYESIFVSPYLLLFDSKNDAAYNVLVTDKQWEEKRFKNGRTFVNLTLNLEIRREQILLF